MAATSSDKILEGKGDKKMKKMAMKWMAITKLLSCLVVCMFLMSAISISVVAMNDNNTAN